MLYVLPNHRRSAASGLKGGNLSRVMFALQELRTTLLIDTQPFFSDGKPTVLLPRILSMDVELITSFIIDIWLDVKRGRSEIIA